MMGVTYFKRYRMERLLDGGGCYDLLPLLPEMAPGYRLVPWHASMIESHAVAKYRSFYGEIDAQVFPCLGDLIGCHRLMQEISDKHGFLPTATWLLTYQNRPTDEVEYCGTIQGIVDSVGCGNIQNLGVVPEHRGRGLGGQLLLAAVRGFSRQGLRRASLEVTAQNDNAIRLYRRMGFRRVKTVYKAVEVAYS